ncbi:PREDICTED: uncharacterized protein LOC105359888 [Ceratosolen solmsi marchali]|uniref:Uncharacterized protein LOC105359888 n=1 Tax=Ceratosolen solmsi marchali TaxID=326594 RepID=A0AAJ6VKJ9_9HYME|nr:PREDICTED: uncharacterized protein LOC105359888 [Ceratosolen solmsi marchali]
MSQLPGWLWPNSNILSPLYKRIWETVQDDCCRTDTRHGEALVDTNKIFPLLLTSQLSTEVLGYIWSLANQKYAGQLTEQELYVVLALVALAQASYPFSSLEVLCYIRNPPMPTLNLSLFDVNTQKNEMQSLVSSFEASINFSFTNKNNGNVIKPNNLSSNIDVLPYEQNYSNNMKDIKFSSGHSYSYNTDTIYGYQNFYNQSDVRHQLLNFNTDSSDDFCDFQSGPDLKQGSAIGSRLANHNLGVKKLNDKIKKFSVNKSNKNNQTHNLTTFNSTLCNKEIESNKHLSLYFPNGILKNQEKTVILKDTAIRNNDHFKMIKPITKNFISNTENVVLNKIGLESISTCSNNIDTVYTISTPLKELKEGIKQDLMILQPTEDKYSALRMIVDETSNFPKSNEKPPTYLDDFGEFVSAENVEPISLINSSNTVNSIDLLGVFDFNQEDLIGITNKCNSSLIQEITDGFNVLTFEDMTDQYNKKKDDITEQIVQKDSLFVNNIELDHVASTICTHSESMSSLDSKSFLQMGSEYEEQIKNMIYWKWKHYMESCIVLLQVAANIFTNIRSKIILKEVLLSAQGYNFLCNLAEVAAICRRINFSCKEIDINIIGFNDLLMNIDQIWSEMEPFYLNIPIVTELPSWPAHQEDGIVCALCLTIITTGRVISNKNNYHITCANLWLNIVNNNLPVLQYPLPYL